MSSTPVKDQRACPACGVALGVRCRSTVNGVEMDWDHDARILAPVIEAIVSKRL